MPGCVAQVFTLTRTTYKHAISRRLPSTVRIQHPIGIRYPWLSMAWTWQARIAGTPQGAPLVLVIGALYCTQELSSFPGATATRFNALSTCTE